MTRGVIAGPTTNRKLSATPFGALTTHVAQGSCPTSCPFYRSGCYAENGPQGFVTRRINAAGETAARLAKQEAVAIDALPRDGRPLRLHTVGDCRTATAARTVARSAERFRAGGGGPVWSYTHAWRTVPRAAWGGVSILASCETRADCAAAETAGYGTARVVDKAEWADGSVRVAPDGAREIPCPEQTGRTAACDTCRLCWQADALRSRRARILFLAHGASRQVAAVLNRKKGKAKA